MSQPITEPMWQRMPWHPKARIVAELERSVLQANARLEDAYARLAEAARITRRGEHLAQLRRIPLTDVEKALILAEDHLLRRGGTDALGPARLEQLDHEIRLAAESKPAWARRKAAAA